MLMKLSKDQAKYTGTLLANESPSDYKDNGDFCKA